jgi:hypothetical protein
MVNAARLEEKPLKKDNSTKHLIVTFATFHKSETMWRPHKE